MTEFTIVMWDYYVSRTGDTIIVAWLSPNASPEYMPSGTVEIGRFVSHDMRVRVVCHKRCKDEVLYRNAHVDAAQLYRDAFRSQRGRIDDTD